MCAACFGPAEASVIWTCSPLGGSKKQGFPAKNGRRYGDLSEQAPRFFSPTGDLSVSCLGCRMTDHSQEAFHLGPS